MRRSTKRKLVMAFLVMAALCAAASYFLYSFYIPDEQAEVQGNIRYTDAEIRRMAMPGFKEHNSLYLRFFQNKIELPDESFIDSIEVEYLGPGQVRLHANEEYPVGYLLRDGWRYYFTASGIVTESLEDEPLRREEERARESALTPGPAEEPGNGTTAETALTPGPAEGTGNETTAETALTPEAAEEPGAEAAAETALIPEAAEEPGNGTTAETALTQEAAEEPGAEAAAETALIPEAAEEPGTSADTGFRPALTDVAMVSGLTEDSYAAGEQIQVQDMTVFRTLQTLEKLINKLDIFPDEILIDPDGTMELRYEEVLVDIGADRMLDEKMSRAAAILPQLKDMKGTLHLENFSSGTVNIIFSAENI